MRSDPVARCRVGAPDRSIWQYASGGGNVSGDKEVGVVGWGAVAEA